MQNILQKSTGFIIIQVLLISFFTVNAFSENMLKAVAIQYKTQSKDPQASQEYNKLIPASKINNFSVIPGEERTSIQPVLLVQNVSDKDINFSVAMKIYNNDLKRYLAVNTVPVTKDCLTVGTYQSGGCIENPDVRVRYCSVTKEQNDYKIEYLQYPGNNNFTGLPPGGYAEIECLKFIPNPGLGNNFGNCTLSLIIIPIDPDTKLPLDETDFSDDTLNTNLIVRKQYCAELFYPENGDSVNHLQNSFYTLRGQQSANNYRIEISKNIEFNPIYKVINNFREENVELDEGMKYYWKFSVEGVDSTCISETQVFYTKGLSGVVEKLSQFNILPNPASDFINIQLPESFNVPEDYELQIFNLFGIEVISELIHPMTGSHHINVSALYAGVYYIKIGDRVEKFIKF